MTATEMTRAQLLTVVRQVATALDNVGGRIYSSVNPDSSYQPFDEPTANLLSDFTAYAETQLAVLDNPDVKAALDAVRKENQ